jgi:hypothetical protein
MKQFISPLTVQNLQAAAALLMGYDYFLSPYLKAKAGSAARAYLQAQHDFSSKQMALTAPAANEVKALVLAVMMFIAIFSLSMLAAWALYRTYHSGWWIAAASLVALFFVAAALQGVAKLLAVFIGPRVAPALFLPLAKFLLFSSKGVIAALGFLLLIASFICRYINELN